MKALVLGYGISGKAAEKLLKKKGFDVICLDQKVQEGAFLERDDFPIEEIDLFIVSPGIKRTHPLILRAKKLQIEILSEMELALRSLKNKAFAVTGTNGKTSTVLLTEHILKEAGQKARALGNVGIGLSSYLLEEDLEETLILEMSSFQLFWLSNTPPKVLEMAVILNISENHLDWHSSMEEYVHAKARISSLLKEGKELRVSQGILDHFQEVFPEAISFEKTLACQNGISYTESFMPSKQVCEAAYLLCKRCGVTDETFLNSLKTFRAPSHRIEKLGEVNGVFYYNDSKSSNVQSVIYAVEKTYQPIVLIVGGVHKGASYRAWIEPFRNKVKHIIAYGEASSMIEYEIAPYFSFFKVPLFEEAVKKAKEIAEKSDAVLLSPGCSSYDQFDNYQKRGDMFKRLVRGL